ncbi:MAG: PQQ-like beta-propeller repeat protein [Theionarchaea archaeon]|nr:PQQ-like beta-propeller repeat protein [Theionarchaea archaeon]
MWEFPLHERAGYSPAYIDRNVIINAHELKVLDVETGQELWSYPAEGLYDTSPVVNGNTIVTVSKDDSVVSSIDTATHELLWEYNLNSDVYSTPAVCDGKIIVLTRDGMLVALDQTAGKLLWKKEIHEKPDSSAHDILRNTAANFVSSPAIADNKIYVGLWSGTFLCLNLETGKTLWKYHTGGSIVASPAVADGKVFIASTDGKIYCFGINPEPPSRLFEHSFLLLGSTGIIIVIFIIYRIINRKNKK